MITNQQLVDRFVNGKVSGRCARAEIRVVTGTPYTVILQYKEAVLAARDINSGKILLFNGWYGRSRTTSRMLNYIRPYADYRDIVTRFNVKQSSVELDKIFRSYEAKPEQTANEQPAPEPVKEKPPAKVEYKPPAEYIPDRKLIDKIEKLFAFNKQAAILLIGEAGVGKNALVSYLAKKHNQTCHRINCDGATTPDLFLGKNEIKDGETRWSDGILPYAMRNGDWLVVDEVNFAPPEMLALLHSLLDDAHQIFIPDNNEYVKPAENFRLFATMNPFGTGRYGGTVALNEAFADRFWKVELEPPLDRLSQILGADFPVLQRFYEEVCHSIAEDVSSPYTVRKLQQWVTWMALDCDEAEAFMLTLGGMSDEDKVFYNKVYQMVKG